jgi:acyl-CoA synthetase (AMP-forming)/AMP-acid ligase II
MNSKNSINSTNSINYNVAQSLDEMAARAPFRRAIVFPSGRDAQGRAQFIQFSFEQLNQLCNRYAHGLANYGIRCGDRTLMLVRPGVELIAVTFALFKIGAVPVIIDPGMGRKAFLQCVSESEPTAFIGISLAHALRVLSPKAFRTVRRKVTVGRRWFWRGAKLDELKADKSEPFPPALTSTEDEGAIVFTSGSTGIPKGVIYLHGMFRAQIEFFRNDIGIAEGEVDLPGLPIFALFNPALGVTTIIPDMDPRKPAEVNPALIVETIQTHGVTNSFGSPTIWKRVVRYCLENEIELPSLRRIFMAGAPTPPQLIEDFMNILDDGDIYTPFGSTEALPTTNISGREILAETAHLTEQGWGVCVGRPLAGLDVRVITLTDEPIPEWNEALVVPDGELGEIAVKGPVVTRSYLNRPVQTAEAKIRDDDGIWHRMGDLGYFDKRGRLWMCGRKLHRVETEADLLLPVPCEAIFNAHPEVSRTALVGVGPFGQQRPVLVVEPSSGKMPSKKDRQRLIGELLALGREHEHTQQIQDILFHKSFPVDVRHNVKIQREKLSVWAGKQL